LNFSEEVEPVLKLFLHVQMSSNHFTYGFSLDVINQLSFVAKKVSTAKKGQIIDRLLNICFPNNEFVYSTQHLAMLTLVIKNSLGSLEFEQRIYPKISQIIETDDQLEQLFTRFDAKFMQSFLIGLLEVEFQIHENKVFKIIVKKLIDYSKLIIDVDKLEKNTNNIIVLLSCISSNHHIGWEIFSLELINVIEIIVR
jgi:hypothetical protein